MVDTVKCDHCGAEARHVVTKEFDGKVMNFCCRGCLGVYEMMREEGLHNQAQIEPGGKNSKEKEGGVNRQHLFSHKSNTMKTVTYSVPDISCSHCIHTIQTGLAEVEGVQSVKADLALKEVEIVFDLPASEEKIKALLAEIDYPVAE